MDNFKMELCSKGKEQFTMAMEIAFRGFKTCVGYRIDKDKGIVLSWAKNDQKGFTPFPYELNHQQTIDFVWGWLEQQPIEESEPDHDGENTKGFQMMTDNWGKVNDWQEFIAIKPIWAMHGK